jgi:hypothetical protein
MCHPLTPREATQAPVANAALAKVSSTTVDMYPCLKSFHFDMTSASSSHKAWCRDSTISFKTLWCSTHKRLYRGGAKELHKMFFSSNPDRFTGYNDGDIPFLFQVPPVNTEIGYGNRLGVTHSKSLREHYPL